MGFSILNQPFWGILRSRKPPYGLDPMSDPHGGLGEDATRCGLAGASATRQLFSRPVLLAIPNHVGIAMS